MTMTSDLLYKNSFGDRLIRMTTVTIPQESVTEKRLVAIPQKEYEELRAVRKLIKFIRPTAAEKRIIARGKKEIRHRQYREWHIVKHELARRTH